LDDGSRSMKVKAHIGEPRFQWVGPVFLIFALTVPNAIFLSDLLAEHWPLRGGTLMTGLDVLIVTGMTLLFIGSALAIYQWTPARRLVHIGLLFILLDIFYRITYGGPVSPGLLQAVRQTSQQETLELLAGHPMLTASLSLVALGALFALFSSWRTRRGFALWRCLQIGAVGLVMLILSGAVAAISFAGQGSCCTQVISRGTGVFPVDVAVSFAAVVTDWYHSERDAASRAAFTFPNPRLVRPASRQNVREVYVIVVGETSRRQNWSLFGYPRHTNPELEQMAGDLVLYRATSNATNTVLSLPMALTRATPATRHLIRSEKSILTLLKEAGFETFWISNQERANLPSNPIYQIALEAQHTSFHGDVLEVPHADRFDTNLLTRLDGALAQLPQNGKAVIFLHMEGSHFSYQERYPPQFERFSSAQDQSATLSDRQRKLIDQYDNSVLFTDYILARVIAKLAACDCVAGTVFFSDHGERLFDNGITDQDFGHGFPEIARQEIEIPFIVWLSPAYRRANPALTRSIRANANSVAELHDLFETIVDLTGVDYDKRASALSLFSDAWQPPTELSVLSMDDKTVTLPVGSGTSRKSHDER
jgi:glucan phosphoethanolaminetransferase (alkaline phosphatase superfamily)